MKLSHKQRTAKIQIDLRELHEEMLESGKYEGGGGSGKANPLIRLGKSLDFCDKAYQAFKQDPQDIALLYFESMSKDQQILFRESLAVITDNQNKKKSLEERAAAQSIAKLAS